MSDASIYYSTDGEIYNFSSIDEAIEDLKADGAEEGTVAAIWQGEAFGFKASRFAPTYVIETMSERANDELGEYVAEWPDCTKEQEEELKDAIAKLIDQWADKHDLHPKFYGIKNDVCKHYRITESGYEETTEEEGEQ